METLTLGPNGRTTTRLGFGGSSIMGLLDRRQSLALLESAFDAGIRHFDTAPMYGYGESESCLGEFLARHRGSVTVTTKFGIPAGTQSALARTVRSLARPVLQAFPALKKRVQGVTTSAPAAADAGPRLPNPIFTAGQARQSLEQSLRQLRTERIDLWLLHEVRAIDLSADPANDPLLRMMQDAVAEGKVGLFGVGSDRGDIPALLAEHADYCGAVQCEWSVLDAVVAGQPGLRLHHRALSQHFQALTKLLETDAALCRRWSDEVGEDLAQPAMLARLMLKASYVLNPGSMVLFSSKRPEHIVENVATVTDAMLDSPAHRLHELFRRERPRVHG